MDKSKNAGNIDGYVKSKIEKQKHIKIFSWFQMIERIKKIKSGK